MVAFFVTNADDDSNYRFLMSRLFLSGETVNIELPAGTKRVGVFTPTLYGVLDVPYIFIVNAGGPYIIGVEQQSILIRNLGGGTIFLNEADGERTAYVGSLYGMPPGNYTIYNSTSKGILSSIVPTLDTIRGTSSIAKRIRDALSGIVSDWGR